jgi:hypothetical protein
MTERSATLVHELWEEADARTMVCEAGPDGDGARATLGAAARLAWVFEGCSHFDTMARYYDRMDWGPYTSDLACDFDPYPIDRILKQRGALEKEIGNRDVIAAGRAARAWQAAAADLGIRLESPFAMQHNGTTFWCAAFLPEFGGPKGAIIACRHSHDEIFDVASALGFYASGLSPYHYELYDRASFSETLNDWGWFGDPSKSPAWFSGAHRRHGGLG